MVNKIITTPAVLCVSPFHYVHGQVHEYIVENVDNVPSYYYVEKAHRLTNLLTSNVMIQVIDDKGRGIQATVSFLDCAENDSAFEVSTDSSGIGYLPKQENTRSHFIIQPKGDLLNGIEGWLNLKDTRKLTIVLGHQSVSKVRVKSVSALNTDDIQLIVNSLRKGDCPSETSGITVEVYVEI